MNLHTFKDAIKSKRSSLANEIIDDDDDDAPIVLLKREVEGEEDEGNEQFNEAGDVIEAFNMKNEREAGYIDEGMNYVFKTERGEIDAWVAEMDEVAMEKAIGEAAMAVKRKNEQRIVDELNEAKKVKKSAIQLKRELLSHMLPSETVAATMRRLSGASSATGRAGTSTGGNVVRRRPPVVTSDDGSTSAVRAIPASELINQAKKTNRIVLDTITELSDELLSKGLTGIYSMTYEALQNSTWLWEYKGLDGVVYGPFTASQLSNWKTQGYFAGSTAVLVRPVGENARMDGDNETTAHHSSSAKSSTSSHSKSVVSSGSIYDDDMLDITFSEGNNMIGNNSSYAASKGQRGYDWTSSDEVDFGEYVNLDNDDMVSSRGKGTRAAKQSKVRTAALAADDSTAGYVEKSRSRSRLDRQDDDDDDDGEDDDDGMSFRHKRKKVQHEEDDDDD